MAYGLKYSSSAYGLSSLQWKVEIYEKDFTPTQGALPVLLSLVGDGIKIGYDREEDRFNTVYSRYAIIDLKVTNTFNIDTLQFDDERKFLIKIYRGNNIEFVGWQIPFFSSQAYEDVSISTISIQAKDGINQLKSVDFVDEYPLGFSNKQTVASILSQCLRKLDYNLDLEVYYNKYEDGMFKTSSDCPLGQLFINVKSLRGPEKWKDNFEVIKSLLSDHDLRIFQANGKWIVISDIEIIDGSVTGRRYNYLGEKQVPSVTLSSDLVIGAGGLKIKFNSIVRKGIPIQSFVANFQFGQSRNLVVNGEFENFIDYKPERWVLSNNWENGEVTENLGGGIVFKNTYATRSIGINSDVPINDASLTQNKYLESSEINIETLGTFSLSSEIFTNAEIDAVRVRIQFYNEGNTNEMYVTNDGKLTFVPTSIYMYNNGVDSFKMLTLTWNNLNQYGTPIAFKYMKVRIYEGIRLRAGVPLSSEVKYKSIKVAGRPLNVVGEFIGKRVEVRNTALPTSKKYDDVLFTYKDVESFAKDPEHVHKMYLSDAIGEANATSGKWKRTSETNKYTLIESRLIDRLSKTTRFGDIFEGSIFGYVSLEKTPYITSSNKRFLLLYCEYNIQENSTEIVAIELYANDFSISTKVSNVFSDGTVIDVENDEFTTKIDVGEKFDEITSAGGTMYGGLYPDYGIDSLPANSTDPRATNKGTLVLGPVNAQKIELGNRENQTLVEILGRLGIRNTNNFLAQFSVADLTANHTVTIPNRNIEVNKWADLSGVPSLFSPTTHTHQIGDITNLNAVLEAKQPINGNLTSIGLLSTNGIVKRTGLNTFVVGTNDPITLSGDVTGIGTTAIVTTLANTGVAAGVYKSVTVDAKGRVTAGTLRSASNFLSDFGFIEDYSTQWNTRWLAKIDDFIEFGSDIQINGGLGVIGNLFLNGNFFDKDSSIGSANQVLMPASGGGVAWTSLSTAQISNFSANVLGQLLTGYTVGSNTPLVASNSILTAFRNLQAQITAKTTAERLVFGNGFFQNHQFGNGFEYKTSAPVSASGLITGLFSFGGLTANRTWNMPDYNGTLTTYEKIDTEFWKIGGNNNITANAYFNIQSKYDLVNNVLVQQQPYSYIWAINQVDKMRLTPQGNLGVGGINPEAVIHAHATVVGNAEVIALKASNNTSSAYFSIGIDSTNNRTNFYAGGEVWATTVSKFKFAAADVSGLWTYSVIPQTTADATTGNQLVRLSQVQTLLSGGFSISTSCKLAFDTDQSFTGAKTQGGYTTVTGDSILLTKQNTAHQNGVYIFDGTNWTRNTNNDTDTEIRGKGHLVTNGTYASTQWVNNNASSITVGTTAITYAQWSGAELDPVWEAYKAANDLTPTRFANWNTAYDWGNHTNLYVDKVSAQSDIAGAKTFTTSIQSPQVRAGNNTLYINISNHFGSSPRIASTAHMDFFATTDYYWYTNGNLGRMRLRTNGLRIGDTSEPVYALDVAGNVGITGLINVRNPFTGNYSNGTDGQVILRKSVSGLNYNEWTTLGVANISDIAATYQAKITGTENYLTKKTAINFGDSQLFDNGTSVVIGGTSAIDSAKFSVVGKIGATTARFGDNSSGINIGSLAINSTGALAYGATSHTWNVSATEKLNLDATRLLLTGNLEIDGKIKVGGSYGLDHYFIKSLGVDESGNPLGTEWAIMNCGEISDIANLYVSKIFADANYVKRITDDGERGFYLYGDAENTIKDGFIFSNPDTGIVGIHSFRLNNTTTEQFGYQLDKDGLPYWLFADGSRKRILTTNDTVGGGGGIWNGGIVSNPIYLTSFSALNFQNSSFPNLAKIGTYQVSNQTDPYLKIESEKGIGLEATTFLNLSGDEVAINNLVFDTSNATNLVGQNAKFAISQIDFGRYKATLVLA